MPRRATCGHLLLALAAATTAHTFAQDAATSLESQCARFEPAQNASLQLHWTLFATGAGGPYTRISHTTAALTSPPRVLIIGGIEYESAQPVVVNTTIVYDPATDTFRLPFDQIASSVTPIAADDVFTSPASRVEHASTVAGPNIVLLFGGQNAAFLNDLWRLCMLADQATWDQFIVPASDAVSRASTPDARIGHSLAVVFENATFTGAIVFGGLSEAYEDVGNQVSLALVARSSVQGACSDRSPRVYWRTLRVLAGTTQPDPRAYHAAVPVSRIFVSERIVCMLLFGGRSTGTNLIYGDVWRMCPVATTTGSSISIEAQLYQWEQLSPIGSRGPGPRYGAAIAFIDEGKVAIAGGSYAFPNDFLSDVWEFNINATQWLSLRFDADFTPPRRGHAITLLGDRLFLFGGRNRYSVVNQRMQGTTYAAPYCANGLKITLCDATSMYVCVPCPAGYFLESGTRNCLPCDAGSYAAEGAAVCTKCPAGTFNLLPAQTRVTSCVACPRGSFSSVEGAKAATTCLPCAAGSFAASTGTSSCASCPAGSFSNANASSCLPCGVGMWSGTAAAQCTTCAAGAFNPRNGSAVCFSCPMGFYSDPGAATCIPCPVNTFSAIVSTPRLSACVPCPALTSTAGELGCAKCSFCSLGTSLGADGASCLPCPRGSYSRAAETNGACLACPLHTYSNATSGAFGCVPCPLGTLTTATGSTSADDCRVCGSTTQVFDGQSCRDCSPGTSLSVDTPLPTCVACVPGTYSASISDASSRVGCQSCPTMAVAPLPSATSCTVCPDGSYAMAAWRSCISCVPSFLITCPVGRNRQVCSGNGDCALRSCTCASGWMGGDCSSPSSASVVSAAAATLYFPSNQTNVVRTRSFSASTFAIRIKRAGSFVGELRARVQVKSTNTSSIPSSTFPAAVLLASGVGETTLTFSTSAFSSSAIGSNCRWLSLELVDNNLPSSSPSMVASEATDRTLTIYFDDLNGPNGATGSSQPRSLTTQYVLATAGAGMNEASAPLDRVVATKLTLQPLSSVSLSQLPLNLRIAIDSTGADSRGIADLLPAVIARIQATYASSTAIRVGLLNSVDFNMSTVSVYQPPLQFYDSAKRALAYKTTPTVITWQWLADRIGATNTTQWRLEDSAQRRFILAFLTGSSLSGDPTVLATNLRQHAAFAFIVLAPGQSYGSTIPSDVMQIVSLTNLVSEIPQKLAAALQQRDASPSSQLASVLTDANSLVPSGAMPLITMGASELPTLDITLNPLPAALSESVVLITVPGFALLTIKLREPGASCSRVSPPETLLPMDDEPMSGWIGAWHLLSDFQWRRQWKVPNDGASPSIQLRRYNDSSLYRTTRTSVVALISTARVLLERTFDGALVAPGLDLVAKAYARHTASQVADGISCALSLQLVPMDTNLSTTHIQHRFTTLPDWMYVQLTTAVPFDVASMRLRLDCNASQAVDTVEWTSLGLFPDPHIACLCPRGLFYDSGACVRCPAGSYCVAGIKRACPVGFFSFGKADHCEKCRDGWICLDGLVRLCEAGTYASSASFCLGCPRGYACRNGMKTSCPIGTFSLAQSSDCQLCQPGTISTTEGAYSCTLCPLGSTSNYSRDHCVPCLPGETTTYRGQHPCSSCAATVFPSRAAAEVCVAIS